MDKPLRVLSLGWGVQSWTLAAMAALGEIEPIDVAIHADTRHEASGTYTHAEKWTPWLEEHGVKVVTVSADSTDVVMNKDHASVFIPAYTIGQTGKVGQTRRQCTGRWKIMPIRKYLRSLLPSHPPAGSVQLLTGISLDEFERMKDSDVAYVKHVYPLVEARIRRSDCVAWLEDHGLDVPPKSSCVFCPYRSPNSWKELKRHGGDDWDHAVKVDNAIRDKRLEAAGLKIYAHRYLKPLAEAISIPEDVGARQMVLGEDDPTCDSGFCFT